MVNTKQLGNAVLSTAQLSKSLLGIDTVDPIIFSKSTVAKILTAQTKQYGAFNPTGYFAWPKGSSCIKATGVVALTAMAMVDSDKEDFRLCHEDLASRLKFPDAKFASGYYRFMHGGQIDDKDASKGDDPIIKPDGLVQFFFDSDKGLKDEIVVKRPRTIAQLSAEKGLTPEQKHKLKGDFFFSVFPTAMNKSYYYDNDDALESIENMRSHVAQALCRTNDKADQGQVVQVLILGFTSGYYLMTKRRNKSLELRAKGKDVPIDPYGIGIYMPAWTILSREIVRVQPDYMPVMRGGVGYASQKVVTRMSAEYKRLGMPYVDPVEDNYQDLWAEATKALKNMGNKTETKEIIEEVIEENPKHVRKEPKASVSDATKTDSNEEDELTTIVGKRRKSNKAKSKSLGLDGLDSTPSGEAPASNEKEPKKRKRPNVSDLSVSEVTNLRGKRDRK